MSDKNGIYSIVQFSARPSSFEFINVGVVIAMPNSQQICIKISENAQRVKKLFDDQSERDFKIMASSFGKRLHNEFKNNPSSSHLSSFADSRANLFRLLPFKPMLVSDINTDVSRLFEDLVGHDRPKRRHSASRQLTELFKKTGVIEMVQRPEPVLLHGFDQAIRADYGYQNGHYNLIEAVSFKPKEDVSVLMKVSGKAHLLKQHSHDKRLIVVVDLHDNSRGLYSEIENSLKEADAKVYLMSDMNPLIEDIKRQWKSHHSDALTH